MSTTFKPYRLINAIELEGLQQNFEKKLQHWNEEHALLPLYCRLGLGPTKLSTYDLCWAKAQPTDSLLAKTNSQDLSLIKHSLFGDESTCFNALAESQFTTLLNQLFGTQSQDSIDDWFYPGSPSLTLTLNCADKIMLLYIHPQWVLNALPSHTYTKQPAIKLQDALATQPLKLHVELNPLSLSLGDIMRLQVGDVIKTDHPIMEPAQLSQQNSPICHVDIGKFNSFKSIQITRTV